MSDMERLIAAVEATGDDAEVLMIDVAYAIVEAREEADEIGADMLRAYNGSLDAALRLHEALLPGWDYCIDYVQRVKPLVYVQDDGGPTHDGEADTPARAWLLAILRAMQASTETGE